MRATKRCFVFRVRRNVGGKTSVSRYWYGRYQLPGDPKPTTVPLKTSDKQVAESKLRRLVQEMEQEREGLIAPSSIRKGLQTPVAEQFGEYLAELGKLGRNEKYLRGVRMQLSTLAKECGWKFVKDVSPDSFRAWRQKQSKSAKTLNEYLIAICAFLDWLEREERIPRNPLRSVKRVEKQGEGVFRRRALSEEETRRLLANAGPRRPVYLTALKTGLRRGELAKLEWQDVRIDGAEPFLSVRASTTKNKHSAQIPLDPELASELGALRGEGFNPKGRVFAGLLPRISRFRMDLKAAKIEPVNEAGERVDFHALRKTFQMLLTLNGASPRVAMELMRHSDMKLTMLTYTDAGQLPTRKAINALPSLLKCTPYCTPEIVPSGSGESRPVTEGKNGAFCNTLESSGLRLEESAPVTLG